MILQDLLNTKYDSPFCKVIVCFYPYTVVRIIYYIIR